MRHNKDKDFMYRVYKFLLHVLISSSGEKFRRAF